jgi:hypothetical protein
MVSFPAYGDTMNYKCKFDMSSSPDGLHKEVLSFEYMVDMNTRKAYALGNNASSEVTLHRGLSGLSFIEILTSGAVQTTTVDNHGNAVHSRNTIFLDRIMPSQFYGRCE